MTNMETKDVSLKLSKRFGVEFGEGSLMQLAAYFAWDRE